MPKPSLTLIAAALLLTAAAGPALAHAHLLSETPAADTAGPSPESLALKFSEGLELKFTTVVVTGPNGSAIATGPEGLAPGDATRLVLPVGGKLEPGRYRVDWHAVATDGHKTSGTYVFTVTP